VRTTSRLPQGTIVGNKYVIQKRLSSHEEENNLCYLAFDSENSDKNVFIRELVFTSPDEKFIKGVIDPLLNKLLKLTNIGHPNLIPVYHVFSEEDKALLKYRVYIVTDTEVAHTRTLAQVIKDYPGEIPFEKIKEWILQICDALEVLHNFSPAPIIYYDLSPENILVTEDGTVKLYDYGCQRMIAKGFYNNRYMGTPGYSAPEQYGLKPIDARADIFGVGALLYYLLTGKDPQQNPLKFEPVTNNSYPKRAGKLVSHCVESDVEHRLQKIEEVKERIERITLDGLKTSVTIKKKEKEEMELPPQIEESFIKNFISSLSWNINKFWYIYTKQILALSTLLVITLIVLGVLALVSSNHGMDTRIMIVGQSVSDLISMDTDKGYLLESFNITLETNGNAINSRDGKYLYITSKTDLLFCFDLKENKVVTQIKTGSRPGGMSFSQDFLAVACSGNNTVSLINAENNNTVANLKSGGEGPVAVCFSSDGQTIFVANKESKTITALELTGNIVATIAAGGQPVDIVNTGIDNRIYATLWDTGEVIVIDSLKKAVLSRIPLGEGLYRMASSPASDFIAVAGKKSQEVYFLSVRQEKVTAKVKFSEIPCSMVFSEDGKMLYVGTSNYDYSVSNIYLYNIENKNNTKIARPKITPVSLVIYKK